MNRNSTRAMVCAVVAFLLGSSLSGQSKMYRLGGAGQIPPAIDGILDDATWREASWDSSFVQREPYDGAVPTELSKFALSYDKTNLYFAIRAYDSDPALITRPAGRRDDAGKVWAGIKILYQNAGVRLLAATAHEHLDG